MFWKRKKIIAYKLIEEPTRLLLEDEIRRCIQQGWTPLGGATQGTQFMYMQTIVKYSK